jgi:hypothetical protein
MSASGHLQTLGKTSREVGFGSKGEHRPATGLGPLCL